MCDALSTITRIDRDILRGGDLETVSVARRMSWAARRKTSRVEDVAYCLLGIFDVNIPLIYGEGRKAFQRLQEAILLKTHDQSLFAWGKEVSSPMAAITKDQAFGVEPIPWKPPKERQPLLGLFADSPDRFRLSRSLEPAGRFSHELRRTHPPALISGGVLLGLVIRDRFDFDTCMHVDRPALSVPTPITMAVLPCRVMGSETE